MTLPSYVSDPAKLVSAELTRLRDLLEEDREASSVEAGIAARYTGNLADVLMTKLEEYGTSVPEDEVDGSLLAFWLSIKMKIDEKYGTTFRAILKAEKESRPATGPTPEMVSLHEEYDKQFQMWKALQIMAAGHDGNLDEFGEFKHIRKPSTTAGGKRLPRKLTYVVNGTPVTGGAGKAAAAAGVTLEVLRTAVQTITGVTETDFSDLAKFPNEFVVTVGNNVEVQVGKSEVETTEDEVVEASV